jgi:hypothetical protein
MCCAPHGSIGPSGRHTSCCCGRPQGFTRRFLSPEEEEDRLKAYRQDLLKEAAEVDKRINALTEK